MINKNIAKIKMICFGIVCGMQSVKTGQIPNRDEALTVVQQNGLALEYADDSLKRDRDVVLAAVQQNGCALEYADIILKRDRDIVLAAVSNYSCAIKWAGHKLESDLIVCCVAVASNPLAFQHINSTQYEKLNNNILTNCTDCMGHWSILRHYLNPEQMNRVKQSPNWSNFMDRLNKEKILAKRVLHEKLNSADLRMRLMSFLISAPKAQLA